MLNAFSFRRIVCATLVLTGVLLGCAPQALAQTPTLTAAVRAAIARQDFAAAEQLVANDRNTRGITPDGLEAMSWLGRGALAAQRWDAADAFARDTYALAVAALNGRTMDQEPHLPIAIGAAMEVRAQVAAHRGERSEAVAMLQRELTTYKDTSLVKRIQKNINLLSLEGTVAPALDLSESLAAKPLSLNDVKGKVVVLFFWAHWCPDCKTQAPILKELLDGYGGRGLTVVAPTQRYGYVALGQGGRSAGREQLHRGDPRHLLRIPPAEHHRDERVESPPLRRQHDPHPRRARSARDRAELSPRQHEQGRTRTAGDAPAQRSGPYALGSHRAKAAGAELGFWPSRRRSHDVKPELRQPAAHQRRAV
ncbi:MAG: TlpA family protein disulfide reductase [Acidobacteria bacterium]|nr:TlpA family protein disulfide reductase [Acidobacteriota bacterium]